ncbi:hypothetical protein [Nodosilinea sp. LEGE 07088]|uniref:hypothetical protein n=1 Tax=Nodosilinea sp. LEGE 07088 TaxID=2777968 RepID=UPI001D13D843|nr:hypothetical protein [Nodosilinea sp. LEGE 07088]
MTLFTLKDKQIAAVKSTQFGAEGIQERTDLQAALRDNINVISPDTMVLSEEFSGWTEGARRIDLLGIDKQANLVVIELKRDETEAHMELQSLRYAAMVSTLTFKRARFTSNTSISGELRKMLKRKSWDSWGGATRRRSSSLQTSESCWPRPTSQKS